GATVRGRNAILQWLQKFPPVSEWTLTMREMDGAGELAWVRGSYEIQLAAPAKLPVDRGQYLEIWRKQADGSWKVVRNVYSSEVAARAQTRAVGELAYA